MLKLKTKWFNKWVKKNQITDKTLLETLDNLAKHLSAANLGGNLFKVRTPQIGRGKSGGFRTIVVYKESEIAIFIYGFSKNEKSNLDQEELRYFKKLAKDLLTINRQEYNELGKLGDFIRIKE